MVRSLVFGSLVAAAALISTNVSAAVDSDLLGIEAKTGLKRDDLNQLREEWGIVTQSGIDDSEYLAKVQALAFAHPEDVDLVRHYIRVAVTGRQLIALKEQIDGYVDSHSEDAAAHYYRGMIDPTAGGPHFTRALEIDPDFYYGQVALASYEMTQSGSDLGQAKKRLLTAARNHPDRSLAFVVLDQFYRKIGDTESSRAAVERAAVADPWDSRIRGTLLQMLQAEGQQAQSNGTLTEWATSASETLVPLARIGDDPSLAFIAARIWGGVANRAKLLEHLSIAADLGYPDYHALTMDPSISRVLGAAEETDSIREKMKANRLAQSDEIRAQVGRELINEPASPASFPLLGGGNVDLASLKGKTVVLDFWATWCGPCRRALPTLQTFYESKPSDVEVYCVNVFERDGGKSVAAFWEQGKYPMPVALGSQADATNYGVKSIPTLFVIGPDGSVRYRHSGYSPYLAETLGFIAELLREEAN